MNFGGRVKTAREHMQWSAVDLAARSGVANTTISALEVRDSKRSEYAEKIIEAFPPDAISHAWLRTGQMPMVPIGVAVRPDTGERPAPAPTMAPILAWDYEDDLPEGEFVMVPRLDVHLSAGNGHEQVEIEFTKNQPQAFRADWIRAMHLKPKKLASMVARGDSMEPRIWDGDALVVDTSQVQVQDGKVYALWYDGGERVKRLYRLPGGGLRIKSDNPSHDTIELQASHVEHVRVIGRVVHVSSVGGL